MIFRATKGEAIGTFVLESENREDIPLIDQIVELFNDDDAYYEAWATREARRMWGMNSPRKASATKVDGMNSKVKYQVRYANTSETFKTLEEAETWSTIWFTRCPGSYKIVEITEKIIFSQ
jgi:hypothetical protein